MQLREGRLHTRRDGGYVAGGLGLQTAAGVLLCAVQDIRSVRLWKGEGDGVERGGDLRDFDPWEDVSCYCQHFAVWGGGHNGGCGVSGVCDAAVRLSGAIASLPVFG